MYYQYFGLTEAPFSIAVNPRYLFMSPRHRDALAHLLYGVGAGGGFILLTGEVGTGKTTINRCLLEQLPDNTDVAIVLNPALNAVELLATVCDELGIGYDPGNYTLKSLTDSLHAYLLANHERNRKTVLMIDEAQHLDFEVLEQIRLLTNLETHSEKLLQIILIGQPELAQMLQQPELRQLNQRITARYNLEPLNLEETGSYIQHRLQVAGMTSGRVVFPNSVVKGIYQRTRGIPRLINVLCDRMLLGAYGHNKSRVDQSMLQLAAREVMGEEIPSGIGWRWPAALALLVLGIAMAAWWAFEYYAPSVSPAAASSESSLPAPTGLPTPATDEVPIDRAIPAEPAPEVALAPAENALAQKPLGTDLAASAEATPGAWLLPPAAAQVSLWSLYSSEPIPASLCTANAQAGVACVEGQAQTWDELRRYDRPLLLEVITSERFSAAVLLLGMDERSGWVLDERGVALISLAEIAPLWTGVYRFLWHPPPGFDRPLALGDSSVAVAEVARLFARLDGQPAPLTGEQFTPPLQQRVRLFQRDSGLLDDGVVGMQTLLKLNEQLNIDATAAVARQSLRDGASAMVQR